MKNLFIITILSFLITSCGRREAVPGNYDSEIYVPRYSSGFKITEDSLSGNRLITVYNPWQGSKDISTRLLILKDSTESIDTGVQTLTNKAERIICMSSTHIAMIDALGEISRIVGVSGKQYVSNPYIQGSDIPDIGYEGNIDYEKIVAAKPDLVLLFSVNGNSAMEPKLKELGIPYVYIADYVEEDPLGKSEWIIPIAEILGKREEGVKRFQEIADNYEKLKAEINTDSLKRPKVMVNAPFLDVWYMPSTESYVAKMIKDAGGDYIYTKNTGNSSKPIDLEEALKLVFETDYWINVGTVVSLDELKAEFPEFINARCIKEGKIYNNNLRASQGGGNDCYESGVIHPDIILRDMIKIFHLELVEEDFTYYRHVK